MIVQSEINYSRSKNNKYEYLILKGEASRKDKQKSFASLLVYFLVKHQKHFANKLFVKFECY